MKLFDVVVIAIVLCGTAGVVALRAMVLVVEYRRQRRVASLLRRNAELLEREALPARHLSPRRPPTS